MQFMKNTNIKRAANAVLVDTHKRVLKSLTTSRGNYSQELFIEWLKQEHGQFVQGDLPNDEGKDRGEYILEVLTEITISKVIKKLKCDPPQTVKEYELIDEQINDKLDLFYNLKDYLYK